MRATRVSLVLAMSLIVAGMAQAGVSLYATCTDGVVACQGEYYVEDSSWQAIVVQWRYGNLCDQVYQLVDTDPVPFVPPSFGEWATSFVAPDLDEWVEYRAFILTQDGDLFPAPTAGDPQPYDWAACANPVLSRGTITGNAGSTTLGLTICPDTCWFPATYLPWIEVEVGGVDPATYEEYLNSDTPVNIWGEPFIDGMPGGTRIVASAIGPVPPDEPPCGPAVGTASATWGTVKSWYR